MDSNIDLDIFGTFNKTLTKYGPLDPLTYYQNIFKPTRKSTINENIVVAYLNIWEIQKFINGKCGTPNKNE